MRLPRPATRRQMAAMARLNDSGGELVVTADCRRRDRDACDDAYQPEHGGTCLHARSSLLTENDRRELEGAIHRSLDACKGGRADGARSLRSPSFPGAEQPVPGVIPEG